MVSPPKQGQKSLAIMEINYQLLGKILNLFWGETYFKAETLVGLEPTISGLQTPF